MNIYPLHRVYLDTGETLGSMVCVPRIGDTVKTLRGDYRVTDVEWNFEYSDGGVMLVVEKL